MSLLDRGRPITVTPKIPVRGRHGANTYTDGIPVTLQGWDVVQQSTTDDGATHLAIGRGDWPGGTHSTVTQDGITYDQVGIAANHSRGRATRHVEVRLSLRADEVR